LYESISYAAADGTALQAVCGRPFIVGAPGAAVVVEGPSGRVAATIEAHERRFVCRFVPGEPGFYRVGRELVAANTAPGESRLNLEERGRLEEAFDARLLAGGGGFAVDVSRMIHGREISGSLMGLALAVLCVEMLLIYFFKRVS